MHGITKLPKQLGAHRVAALALYRALLSQCRRLPIAEPSLAALANTVRHRFRNPRPQRLRLALAFQAGYAALDLLDASVAGNVVATQRIEDYVQRLPARLTRAPPAVRVERAPNAAHAPTPDKYKLEAMFPRPAMREGQRRKVPSLVNAAGLPFIRWKKPQPENVSRVIRSKLRTRQRRMDQLEMVEQVVLPMARMEDGWDALVLQMGAAEGQSSEEQDGDEEGGRVVTYENVAAGCRAEMVDVLAATDARTMDTARRFTAIVLEEARLAKQERAERKAAAKARWLAGQGAQSAELASM